MANSIEQFTAPGKYYWDLGMEKLILEAKDNRQIYIGLKNQPKDNCLFKKNPYYHRTRKK